MRTIGGGLAPPAGLPLKPPQPAGPASVRQSAKRPVAPRAARRFGAPHAAGRDYPSIKRCGSTSSRRMRSSSAVGGVARVDRETSRSKPVFSWTCFGVTPS
jgi:hypothetical protein